MPIGSRGLGNEWSRPGMSRWAAQVAHGTEYAWLIGLSGDMTMNLQDRDVSGLGTMLVIEDELGRYRVTVEADGALFREALKHHLAKPVAGMWTTTFFGSFIESGPWPEKLLGRLEGYALDMRDELTQGPPR